MNAQLLGEEWYEILKEEIQKPYIKKLTSTIAIHKKNTTVFPEKGTFRAFKLTPFDNVKFVIVGIDPYANEQATGIAFANGRPKLPPSLVHLLTAMEVDIEMYEGAGSLDFLAWDGVLLLNRILTVNRDIPLSHANIGWEQFTAKVIEKLNEKKKPIFFIFIGSLNKDLVPLVKSPHGCIHIEHPAYAARQNRPWNFQDCFNKANKFTGIDFPWKERVFLPF